MGDAARTRALFERCITLQLPAKKMKVRTRTTRCSRHGWAGREGRMHLCLRNHACLAGLSCRVSRGLAGGPIRVRSSGHTARQGREVVAAATARSSSSSATCSTRRSTARRRAGSTCRSGPGSSCPPCRPTPDPPAAVDRQPLGLGPERHIAPAFWPVKTDSAEAQAKQYFAHDRELQALGR